MPVAEFQAARVGGSIHFCGTRFNVASKGAIQGEAGGGVHILNRPKSKI